MIPQSHWDVARKVDEVLRGYPGDDETARHRPAHGMAIPSLRERVRSIVKRTKMTYAEVLEFAMERVTDGEFTNSERQPALPFGRK